MGGFWGGFFVGLLAAGFLGFILLLFAAASKLEEKNNKDGGDE